jgi:beta-glucosidase
VAAAQTWTADNGNGTYTNPLFYANLRTSAGALADLITVSVDVTNTGTRTGDEVVQLYVRLLTRPGPRRRTSAS